MEIDVRPLNKGETFCCSIKKVKEMFKDTDVHLNFSFYGRDYSTLGEGPMANYWKKNIRGRIISHMSICEGQKDVLFSFYVLKEATFSADLKEEFEQTYRPKFYAFHQKQRNAEKPVILTNSFMLVEFLEGSFKLHEGIF